MNEETLRHVASKILDMPVTSTEYQLTELKGGTIGDVRLITGIAQSENSQQLPFKVVLKIQSKFERWGDPGSWRREYDLYATKLGNIFSDTFTWPKCYHAILNEDSIHLWLEYAEGTSGTDLTPEMMEVAALELGRYQGKLHTHNHHHLSGITNLRKVDLREIHYRHWKPKNEEYSYVRSPKCEIPKHLTDMIIEIDNRADEIFNKIRKLPVVLYHGDYWHENLIYTTNKLYAIDWDSTGWGYVGEDIAQLITDETNPTLWQQYKKTLIPAYYKGLSENMDIAGIDDCIGDMILTSGYLHVFYFMQAKSPEDKDEHLQNLQQIYETFCMS